MPTELHLSAKKAVLTASSLPYAVGNLLKMNNYDVTYDVHINGAQVDIVAISKADPFANPIYIEVTVEYVNAAKYGKDATKFILIREKIPHARLICLSSVGFTPDVEERALNSRVETLTYEELFAKFEKFAPYVQSVLQSKELTDLVTSYEEPQFNDAKGVDDVSVWFKRWKAFAGDKSKWLIVLGEYGTGKTALTRVLHYRWLRDYHENPEQPIPIRIELRNFNRQFDGRGLLHHFLDTNDLSYISVDFVLHLIKTGRVILLLDGYDEMAQFMNARERRACLSALAELSAGGAKGILTSRPNYFTETEELNVFESLYSALEQSRLHLSRYDRMFIADEAAIDNLVETYILEKYERSLQDLTPAQTEALVRRKLKKNLEGQEVVLAMLARIFREEANGPKQSLSGKPVIISYLLEIVEDLKPEEQKSRLDQLTEWQVYKLIVDRLMLRDMHRTTLMSPVTRRKVLQRVAVAISGRDKTIADEAVFQEIITDEFARELRPLGNDERQSRRGQLFEDLRSSATLTRATHIKGDGWVFSHNSLREFLVAEVMLDRLKSGHEFTSSVPITAAMRSFAASIGEQDAAAIWSALAAIWPRRASDADLGPFLNLLWDRARREKLGIEGVLAEINGSSVSDTIPLSHITLRDIKFEEDLSNESIEVDCSNSTLSDCSFVGRKLAESDFQFAVLDNVSFCDADLSTCNFSYAFVFDCDLSGANVKDADFRHIDGDSAIRVEGSNSETITLTGAKMRGYLKWNGAQVDHVDDYFVFLYHPKAPIVWKIIDKISRQKNTQKLGLTQRGEAQNDPRFARNFVDHLESGGWIVTDKNDLISSTPVGRSEFQRMLENEHLAAHVREFMERH